MPQLANKVVITCAITGSIHTPTMSDALPITPDQIATQSIDAAKAGATILHLHARDPKDGRPSPDPNVFRQFLPRIKQSCDAVINITTGGSVTMTLEDRLAAAETFSPEMCSLNMGSMNFALYPMAKRYKNWKYDWEESYLLNSDQNIFSNTFRDIERIAKVLAGGRHQFNFCSTASMLGGNVRVGLEDSLYIGPGKLASSNAEQVAKIRRIIEELGYQVATPAETRQMLGLKGADKVNF